jgi:Rrf2 family transcriptional regulator, nitric oxide-sensitive transcriptional repressor
MRFSFSSDIAIRLFLYLDAQDKDRRVPIKELCEALDTARSTLSSLVPRLVSGGLIVSRAGKGGGLQLARPLDQILASEVIAVAEEGTGWKFAQCDYESGCKCYMKGHCSVQPMYQYAASKIIRIFDEFRLSDLQRPVNEKNARRFADKFAIEHADE